jgi:hypothetical protein
LKSKKTKLKDPLEERGNGFNPVIPLRMENPPKGKRRASWEKGEDSRGTGRAGGVGGE